MTLELCNPTIPHSIPIAGHTEKWTRFVKHYQRGCNFYHRRKKCLRNPLRIAKSIDTDYASPIGYRDRLDMGSVKAATLMEQEEIFICDLYRTLVTRLEYLHQRDTLPHIDSVHQTL